VIGRKYLMGSTGEKLSPQEWRKIAEKRVLEFLRECKAAHAREIKVALEDGPFHWVTANAIRKLYQEGKLRRRRRSYGDTKGKKASFYYPSELRYADVVDVIEEKLPIIAAYTELNENPNQRQRLGHLAEDFIMPLFEKAGYIVVAKDTRFFRGRLWPRRTDLDFIVYGEEENRWYGVQIKNSLDYPEWDDIAELIDICNFLKIVPWLIARICPKDYAWELIQCGGFVTLFWERRWLLTKENKEIAEKIARKTAIKVTTMDKLDEFAKNLTKDLGKIHKLEVRQKS